MSTADDTHHAPQSFWTRYVWSQDHKVIAIQYASVAIVAGLVGLMLSNLMRLQLGFPGRFPSIDAAHYYQFMTMHGMTMVVYLLTALFLGGFGNYLSIPSAVRIGLIPPLPLERIRYVGNAASLGAQLCLLSEAERGRAETLARRIEHVSLAAHPDFEQIFVDAMNFPRV